MLQCWLAVTSIVSTILIIKDFSVVASFSKEIGHGNTRCHICGLSLSKKPYARFSRIIKGNHDNFIYLSVCRRCVADAAIEVAPDLLVKKKVISKVI